MAVSCALAVTHAGDPRYSVVAIAPFIQPFLDNLREKTKVGNDGTELTGFFMPRSALFIEDLNMEFQLTPASESRASPLEPSAAAVSPSAAYSDLDMSRDLCMMMHLLTGEAFKGVKTDFVDFAAARKIQFIGAVMIFWVLAVILSLSFADGYARL